MGGSAPLNAVASGESYGPSADTSTLVVESFVEKKGTPSSETPISSTEES